MSETLQAPSQQYFDPFAEEGQELFDPVAAHAQMWERYQNKEVEHDYTADRFLADTQALMMDAHFLGRFDEARLIAARMHACIGEDHALTQSLQGNEVLNAYLGVGSAGSHEHKEGHHDDRHTKKDDHLHSEEDDGVDEKNHKRRKRKRSWFGVYKYL